MKTIDSARSRALELKDRVLYLKPFSQEVRRMRREERRSREIQLRKQEEEASAKFRQLLSESELAIKGAIDMGYAVSRPLLPFTVFRGDSRVVVYVGQETRKELFRLWPLPIAVTTPEFNADYCIHIETGDRGAVETESWALEVLEHHCGDAAAAFAEGLAEACGRNILVN